MKINATLPEKGRDLRLDLFRGVANWAIYLDHIPDNVVNWITTRNYGFSDAADLFVFISGYTASFVYARMMLERGFIVGATRLTKRVWQLYVAHIILFVIYIASISYLALRFGDSRTGQRVQRRRPGRQRDRNAAAGTVPEVQARQPRRAAALHRADGTVPAGAVDHAAPAQLDHGGRDRAVAGVAADRLEPARLPAGHLVLQPVRLAGAVRVRRMVRARRRPQESGASSTRRSRCISASPT